MISGHHCVLGVFAIAGTLTNSAAGGVRAQASRPNTWGSVAPMPEGRSSPAVVSADKKLYVFGGDCVPVGTCHAFNAYDPETNTWSMGDMPNPPLDVSSATVGPDGRIYLYGVGESGGTPTMVAYNSQTHIEEHVALPPGVVGRARLITGQDGRIYVYTNGGAVAGVRFDTFSAYDPATHAWTRLAPDPTPRGGDGAAVAAGPDGRTYVMGGNVIGTHEIVDKVEAYDPYTNTWTSVAPLPTPRTGLQAVTGPDGRIYALGGFGECFTYPCTVVEAYDPHADAWAELAAMPAARASFGAGVGPDGRIYVLGGFIPGPGPTVPLSRVDVYTVVPGDQPLPEPPPEPTAATQKLASMPTGRYGLGAASSGGKIYAIGGETPDAPEPPEGSTPPALRTVEAYDPTANTWAAVPPLPAPRMGMGTTTGRDGRIYVLGGVAVDWEWYTYGVPFAGERSVFIYDPQTRRWSAGKSMPDPRYGLAAVTGKDGRIYTIGGATVCRPINGAPFPGGVCQGTHKVRAFNPRTNSWATLAPLRVGLILPTAAAGPDGRIYVFGGDYTNGRPNSSFEVYTPRKNRWTQMIGMPHVRTGGFAAATAGDGRIDVIGGCDSSSICRSPGPVDAYDVRTNTWQTLGVTLDNRQLLAATVGQGGQVYAVGGVGNYDNGTVLEVIHGQ